MESGDLATWVGSIGTSGTLLLGMVLLWRDHSARRDDRLRQYEAQARRVTLKPAAYRYQGEIAGEVFDVFVSATVVNQSDDTIQDVMLIARVARHVAVAEGGSSAQGTTYASLASGMEVSAQLKSRARLRRTADGGRSFSGTASVEWTDSVGYRWRRDPDQRLIRLPPEAPSRAARLALWVRDQRAGRLEVDG